MAGRCAIRRGLPGTHGDMASPAAMGEQVTLGPPFGSVNRPGTVAQRTSMSEGSMEATEQPSTAAATTAGPFPRQPLHHLDALWLQVAGTRCNLACTHCFVSCAPGDARHAMMTRADVRRHLADAAALGVREVYLTGGEPFLHPDLPGILDDVLEVAACTVLTNGTLFTRARVAALRRRSDTGRFSLELRVSLDGLDAATHDAIRGPGTFMRALDGLRALEDAGLLPIVTLTQLDDTPPLAFRSRAEAMLRAHGLRRPRLKLLPLFRLGREAARSRGYGAAESLAGLDGAFDPHRLQCGSCRAVTAQGVYVCPLLVDAPDARMGDTLDASLGAFELRHGACFTCWVTGMTCGNG